MMKKVITGVILLLISGLLFARNRAEDEAGINAAIDAMIFSWNNHNYDDLKNYTTENTDWVNAVGMWWKGRKASQYAHQVYHEGMFKESKCVKDSVSISLLSKNVAMAHLYWHFSAFTDPSGKIVGPDDCIATVIYVKENGKWLMRAGQNAAIVKEVQQYDPVIHTPKN